MTKEMTVESNESFAARVYDYTGMDVDDIDDGEERDLLFPILCSRKRADGSRESVVDVRGCVHRYGGDVSFVRVVV